MITTEERMDVQITNHVILAQLMEHHGYSVRTLSDAVDLTLRKRHMHTTCGRGTIGNLRSGYRKTCSAEVAKIVAELLGLPVAALFINHVSKVSVDVRPTYAKKMPR